MSTGAQRFDGSRRFSHGRESLDEQARRRGIVPIRDVADMADLGIFESDTELSAFLSHVDAERHANLA
ncbi:hypothetical protein Ais01nite_40500 [Asanoa ishikariensis]|uniref:Uncharacterized protein n=1 Tax=Asanoa ishikariensis TaxID=137265 RepID=A0A1H3MCG0_9ACTN|nr:hypothetical protein [Asanoa ishikariensis]GIF66015.1 hypothetical protein Ais01nite_40500 [Asanoa ishikariensis]SDY73705.1 hypothetical protein SAMN05421684_1287 [Asanoa ishikariensis]